MDRFIFHCIWNTIDAVLLDKPIRGMDEKSKRIFSELINSLKEQNKTIIIASHEPLRDLIFDEIYIMKNGNLEKQE